MTFKLLILSLLMGTVVSMNAMNPDNNNGDENDPNSRAVVALSKIASLENLNEKIGDEVVVDLAALFTKLKTERSPRKELKGIVKKKRTSKYSRKRSLPKPRAARELDIEGSSPIKLLSE